MTYSSPYQGGPAEIECRISKLRVSRAEGTDSIPAVCGEAVIRIDTDRETALRLPLTAYFYSWPTIRPGEE